MSMSGMMQMQDMGEMLPGMSEMMDAMEMPGMMAMDAASATAALCSASNFDLAFIDGMIPHHQSAIMMATAAMSNATHPELVDLAHGIVDTQHREIEEMQAWHAQWYGPEGASTPVAGVAPIEVQVSLSEFAVSASVSDFKLGTPYRFIVTNDGAAPHEFMVVPTVEGIGQTPMDDLHHIAVGIIEVDDLPAGATASVDITFTEAGTYELVCALPGHYDAGMKQLSVVVVEG